MEMVGVATSSGVKSAPRSQAMVFLSVSQAFHIQMCEYPRMEGNIVSFLGTARRSESERLQKVLSILFFVGVNFQDRSAIISSPPSPSERSGEGEGGDAAFTLETLCRSSLFFFVVAYKDFYDRSLTYRLTADHESKQ